MRKILMILIALIIGSAAFAKGWYYTDDVYFTPTSNKCVMTKFDEDTGAYTIYVGAGKQLYCFSINVNDENAKYIGRNMTEVVDIVTDMFLGKSIYGSSTYEVQLYMNECVVNFRNLGIKYGFSPERVPVTVEGFNVQGYIFNR